MTDKPDPKAKADQEAKDLAEGLVDTLKNPDPKRAAERAAAEAEKEREDKAALEAFYKATGQKPPSDTSAMTSSTARSPGGTASSANVARARSIHEMHYAASLEPCPQCGTRIDAQQLTLAGNGDGWALTGDCPRCGTRRAFSFRTHGDPLTAPTPRDELAGPEPSEIIAPSQWVAEIDRLLPLVRLDPSQLGPDEWKANRDLNKRLLVTLNELLKFVPAGAAEIPADKLDAAGRSDRSSRPERYQRAWIEEQRANATALRARNVADLPRIEKLEKGGKTSKPATREVELDRAALRTHEKWVEGGKQGKGRLVLVGTSAIGSKIGAAELSGAKLEDCDFTDADLAYATLDGAQLRNVRFSGANLISVSFKGAQVDGGSFVSASMPLAKLDDATIDSSAFTDADLDRSSWNGAKVSRCELHDATFGNAELDGATFVRCDVRGASFAPASPRPDPTTRGTRFEDCDLRGTLWEGRDLSGAIFIRCKFDGIEGRPSSVDDIVIEDADLSIDGDGSDIGTAEDVLAIWYPERGRTN